MEDIKDVMYNAHHNTEALNTAICKWMGWEEFPSKDYKGGILMPYRWVLGDDKRMELPRYVNDLNEMHEAEKKLSKDVVHPDAQEVSRQDAQGFTPIAYTEQNRYRTYLVEEIAEDLGGWKEYCIQALGDVISATALQRAKAIARTLKLTYGTA